MSMDVMRSFNIPVPRGGVASTVEEAQHVYKTVIGEGKDCVIKAMVLAGGRGLGHFSNGFKGGVHLCSKDGDVPRFASKMLGMPCSHVASSGCMYVCVRLIPPPPVLLVAL
ncbi:hypothetical protein EON64_07345 [archaeon]|nr:MAG: hypothetical protein EON64_07345 [archaeon]